MPVLGGMDFTDLEEQDKSFLQMVEDVEHALNTVEEKANERANQRKKILRSEYSKILMRMDCKDTETVGLLKSATMEALLKLKAEASGLRKSLQEKKSSGSDAIEIENIHKRLKQLTKEASALQQNTQLSLEVDSVFLQIAMDQAVYLRTKDCDPKKFSLLIDPLAHNKIMILAKEPNNFHSSFIRSTMQISYTALNNINNDGQSIPIFRKSLDTCIKSGNATVVDPSCVTMELPASPTGFAEIDVSIFGISITHGGKIRLDINKTKPGDVSRFLDETMHRDLDQSDLYSLDMTHRIRILSDAKRGKNIQASGNVDGIPQPFPPAPSLQSVAEVSCERSTQMNETGPFSPNSEAQYSTMRETSAARLAEMLSSASVEIPDPDMEPEVYLAPASEEGRKSVEELQKTLSRENSRENSPKSSIVDITEDQRASFTLSPSKRSFIAEDVPITERSIVFSTKTTIYQELATPQVKVDSRRYSIQEGNTKVADGVAGLHKKLLTAQITDDDEPISQSVDRGNQSAFLDEIMTESTFEPDATWLDQDETNYKWEKTFLDQGPNPALDGTLWDLEPESCAFNFLQGTLKIQSTRRPGIDRTGYLEGPAFMTRIAKHKIILVTEPFYNRVGVYNEETLELKGLFPGRSTKLNKPRHIQYLTDETVAMIQQCGLYIYSLQDFKYKVMQTFKGKFLGLTEGDPGELITIQFINDVPFIKIFCRSLETDEYMEGDCIELTVAKPSGANAVSKPCNLLYRNGLLYITDPDMARLYIHDRMTGEQMSNGYYGEGEGHFKKPLGLLKDDAGNILVSDQETSNMLVFNPKGKFIKQMKYSTDLLNPMGIIRQENSILLCFFGASGQKQGIIRFELEPLKENMEWKGSPVVDPISNLWNF